MFRHRPGRAVVGLLAVITLLAAGAAGKTVRLSVSRAEDASYQAARSTPVTVKVLRPRHAHRHRHHRGVRTSTASGSGAVKLEQECIETAFARPKIEHAEMTHAGIKGEEHMYAQVVSPEVPSECSEYVLRVQKFLFKVQNALHHKHWSSGGWTFNEFAYGNEAGRHYAYVTDLLGKGLYRCTPGRRKTGVRLELRIIALDPETHKPLAKKTEKFPIRKILPKRC